MAFVINATFTGACLTPPVHFKIGDATTDPSEDYNGVFLTVPSGVWTPVTVYFNQLVTQDYTGGDYPNPRLEHGRGLELGMDGGISRSGV